MLFQLTNATTLQCDVEADKFSNMLGVHLSNVRTSPSLDYKFF